MYQIIALVVFVTSAAVVGSVWWYSIQTATTAQQLQSQLEKQNMVHLHSCLKAVYRQGQIVFPNDVVWIKNLHKPNCANVTWIGGAPRKGGAPRMGGAPRYWDGGRCGVGAGHAVSASPGDVVVVPGACHIQVSADGKLLATIYGS
jgi:hypothetical protein